MLFCTWRPARRDSAYSWLVAVAAFTSILFSIGLSFGSVGVMTLALGDYFNDTQSPVLPWVGSSRLSFIFLTGVASSVLVNRFGARTVQLVGCALAALAIGLSTLSTQVWHLLLTYGCLAGIGMSFIFTASSVVVEGHFTRFLHVVLPLTQLGDTVGYSVFPVSTQSLLDSFGFLNTLYFFCGVCGVPALCAMLYTEPPPLDHLETAGAATAASDNKSSGDTATVTLAVPAAATTMNKTTVHVCLSVDVAKSCRQVTPLHNGGSGRSESGSDHVTLLRIRTFDEENVSSRSTSPDDCDGGGGRLVRGTLDSNSYGVNLGATDAYGLQPPAAALAHAKTAMDVAVPDGGEADNRGAIVSTDARSNGDEASAAGSCPALPTKPNVPAAAQSSLQADLRNLVTSGDAWIVFANTLLWPYTSSSIVVLLPSFIVRANVINKDQAALGLTIIGIANVVGNLVTIVLGLRRYNHALFYTASCGALGAGAMIYVVTDRSVAGYYALCAFNGFWLGVILGLVVSIMYDYSGRASFTSVFGFSTFATGLGDLAGGGVTGIIQNQAGVNVGFYVSGAFSLLACVVMLPLAVRQYRRPASVEPS